MSDITDSGRALPSGRFLVRVDPELHGALRRRAEKAGVSLNRYCARKLADPSPGLDGELARIVERAASLLGDALAGVVAFGPAVLNPDDGTDPALVAESPAARSPLHVLLAAEPGFEVRPDLYGAWDDAGRLHWRGHPVEPVAAPIPADAAPRARVWADAAESGVVLYEHDLAVSRRLARTRASTPRSASADSGLARRGLRRAQARLKALDVLFVEEAWGDVVRESHGVVELAIGALLARSGVATERLGDLPRILHEERHRLPAAAADDIEGLARAARRAHRDRALAEHGLGEAAAAGPLGRDDAREARENARSTLERVQSWIGGRAASREEKEEGMSPAKGLRLRLSRVLPAPPEAVFAAWTRPERLQEWFCPDPSATVEADLDLRRRGRYAISMDGAGGRFTVRGSYLEVSPPHRVAFTWDWETRPPAMGVDTVVTVELAPHPDGAEIRVTHEGFPQRSDREGHEVGWTMSLDRLAALLA